MSANDASNMTGREAEIEYDKLMNYEYDGIREYDNPLPFWWVWLWAGSVVFSIGYTAWYHMGKGASIHEKYEVAVTRAVEKQLAGLGEIRADNATILRLMQDDGMMDAVAGIFRGNCAQCHGNEGGGNIGPNLTDEKYKNIVEPADFYTVIAEGIPGTSMPAWSQRLREPQMILLSAYVARLRGTSPSIAIAPEGTVAAPWESFDTGETPTDTSADARDSAAEGEPAPG